ncbi:MarR family winged helix-turn-helix transcriptional regulator [uncultured Cellulomonas sp.]|uniref:MarR family winged helix-turn-helix transcriptional regulator n=1 Tax=uncultured Cellulomonas sp. TaxID=189682 RepID=UPI0026249FD6|nr:MarR family transcriptional regulator [uncultured Cellulomonas sp.]
MTDINARVERELGVLLRRAHASSNTVATRVHPDLDAAAYPLLVWIARTPGVRGSELADQVGVGRATISRQVKRLETLGLLTRRTDPADSRGQLLELTDEGTRRLAEAQGARREWLRAALASWSEGEIETLATTLERLNSTLDEVRRRD